MPRERPGLVRRWLDEASRRHGVFDEYRESAFDTAARALVLTGPEKHTGAPLRAVYFGSGNNLAYVTGMLFQSHDVERTVDGLRAWHARDWLERHRDGANVLVADLPWPWHTGLRDHGYLEQPAWIVQRMAFPDTWDEVFAQMRGSVKSVELRKVRHNRLEHRIVHDEASIRRFYEQMYVPHVRQRFGEAAYVEPEWRIQHCASVGALIEITRDGTVVAAQVLFPDRGSLQFLWGGTLGGEFNELTRGAYPAMNYYGILYAFERGYEQVDYGGSRAQLDDGILQVKRRWAGRICDGWSRDTLFVRYLDTSPGSLGALAHHGPIVRHGSGLIGKVWRGDATIDVEDVRHAEQHHVSPGLGELRLYSTRPPTAEALDATRKIGGLRIVDLSGQADAPAAFCGD